MLAKSVKTYFGGRFLNFCAEGPGLRGFGAGFAFIGWMEAMGLFFQLIPFDRVRRTNPPEAQTVPGGLPFRPEK